MKNSVRAATIDREFFGYGPSTTGYGLVHLSNKSAIFCLYGE
jgi:hypothetical protein